MNSHEFINLFKTYIINNLAFIISFVTFATIQNVVEWVFRVILLIVTIVYTSMKIRALKKGKSGKVANKD